MDSEKKYFQIAENTCPCSVCKWELGFPSPNFMYEIVFAFFIVRGKTEASLGGGLAMRTPDSSAEPCSWWEVFWKASLTKVHLQAADTLRSLEMKPA